MIRFIVQVQTLRVPFPGGKQIRRALNLADDVEVTIYESPDHFHRYVLEINVPFSDKRAQFLQQKLKLSDLPFSQVWRAK